MDKKASQQAFLGWLEDRRQGRKRAEQEIDDEYELFKQSGLFDTANAQPAMKKKHPTGKRHRFDLEGGAGDQPTG